MAKRRKQKQTLKEFQAWLQGVEELQPEGWSPDNTQWKLIRDKIDGIIEEKPKEVLVTAPPAPQNAFAPSQVVQPRHPTFVSPQVGGVPSGPVGMSEEAKSMLSPTGDAKTPHIDTSDGNVNSSFA